VIGSAIKKLMVIVRKTIAGQANVIVCNVNVFLIAVVVKGVARIKYAK